MSRKLHISLVQAGGGILASYREWASRCFIEQGHEVALMSPTGEVGGLGDIVFGINFVPQLAQLAQRIHKPYLCWICDPLVNFNLLNPDWASPYTVLFNSSKKDMASFRRAGYPNSFYLPLTIEPDGRHGTAEECFGVSFVGNCYVPEEVSAFRKYMATYQAGGLPPEAGLKTLKAFIDWATQDLTTPLHSAFLPFVRQRQPAFLQEVPVANPEVRTQDDEQVTRYFLNGLLCHEIDYRMRSGLIRKLAPLGVDVWGDEGWKPVLTKGITYHGFADSPGALGEILSASSICLNMTRRITDIVNMRTFEIAAHGRFQLALASPELAELFEPDKEVACYASQEEALDKATFYLQHETDRRRIAAAGNRRFNSEHTMRARCRAMEAIWTAIGI